MGVLGGRRAVAAGTDGSEPALAVATVLSLLLAPHLLVHDLAILTPVVVWCLALGARSDRFRWTAWPGPAPPATLGLWFVLGWAARGTHPAGMPRRLVPDTVRHRGAGRLGGRGRGRAAGQPQRGWVRPGGALPRNHRDRVAGNSPGLTRSAAPVRDAGRTLLARWHPEVVAALRRGRRTPR